nr:pre-rRNA-processing protein TSR1 homolog [Ipomoea batatas]
MEMSECSCVESSSGAFEGDMKMNLKFKLKKSENANVIEDPDVVVKSEISNVERFSLSGKARKPNSEIVSVTEKAKEIDESKISSQRKFSPRMLENYRFRTLSGMLRGALRSQTKMVNVVAVLSSSEGVEEDAQVISCLTPKQEHLLIENVPDPLAGKQTWPTEEEIVEAERNHKEKELKNKMLLRGTSDYQAAWIVNNSDVDNSESKENDDGDSPSTVTGSLANEVIELTEVEVEFFNALKSSKLSSFSLLLPLSAQYLKEKCLSFELAMSMLEHSDEIDSSAESVTTSTCIGQQIVTKRLGKCLLELSGNNVIFIMDDAEIELVVRSVLFAAVGIDGQRCTTSRRRLLDDETVYQKVLERLLEIYKQIKWGSLGEGYLTWTTAYMCFKGEF